MKIAAGKRVLMEYELAVEGGEVIESSKERGPLEYVHGTGKMLPGLESRIEGLQPGDEKEGVIPAAEAYGTLDSLPTKTIPLSEFPPGTEVKEQMVFEAQFKGNPVSFTVLEVKGDEATVRFNHPLAGKDIRFSVKILDVTDPEEGDGEG